MVDDGVVRPQKLNKQEKQQIIKFLKEAKKNPIKASFKYKKSSGNKSSKGGGGFKSQKQKSSKNKDKTSSGSPSQTAYVYSKPSEGDVSEKEENTIVLPSEPTSLPLSKEWFIEKMFPGSPVSKVIKTKNIAVKTTKVPPAIERAGATNLYLKYVSQKAVGEDTSETEKQLIHKLQSSRWFMSTQPVYDGKTFYQLKQEEPALYLEQNEQGLWIPSYDFVRWRGEIHKNRTKTLWGSIGEDAVVVSQSFLNVFNPDYWVNVAEGRGAEYLSRQHYGDVKKIQSGKGLEVWFGQQVPAYTNVILPMAGGYALGMGVGAFKATSAGSRVLFNIMGRGVTAGKLVETGMMAYGTYELGKSAVKDPLRTGIQSVISFPGMIAGYKAGHSMGFGRTEEFLYLRQNYTPGSMEYIRAKNILKTARRLQFVRSGYEKPLDFTRDIMRLDKDTASRVISYLENNPRSVIGGSASSYAQTYKRIWFKYRSVKPRDIDLLVKDVTGAKKSIGGMSHQVDIHGFEFGGKGGRYYRFGFETQSPTRIGGNRYMRLGEQVFRKGVSSVTKETSYRWFKDIPDFRMAAEQLIVSGKKSYNPFARLRVSSASKSFGYVLNPRSHPSYGKSSFFDTVFKRIKPVEIKAVFL